MSGDCCKCIVLNGVEVQENGIIRDRRGWIIGRADDEWMRYQWRMLESGVCPCCGNDAHPQRSREEGADE